MYVYVAAVHVHVRHPYPDRQDQSANVTTFKGNFTCAHVGDRSHMSFLLLALTGRHV